MILLYAGSNANNYLYISSDAGESDIISAPGYFLFFSILFIILITATLYLVAKRKKYIRDTISAVKEKNKKIRDNMQFAENIQQGVLPDESKLKSRLGEYLLIYRPKDVVSGDFFWVKKINGKIFAAVADCTGHGVPGAFMSMIAYTLLNQIVIDKKIYNPAMILRKLHRGIRLALKQEKPDSNTNDGMDMAFCVYDPEKQKLSFSGANRPLFLLRDYKLLEIKGDRKSIGGRQKENIRTFNLIEDDVKQGDILYMFTDGITDQNNKERKKIGKKGLKEHIINISNYKLKTQESKLNSFLDSYLEDTVQRDDITVLAFRIF